MSITLSVGTQVAIASTYGTSKTMSAISNASSAVATLEASHGVIVGDYLEVLSGWDRLNERIARCTVLSTNDVTLGNIDTQSTSRYPAGTGAGSVREITAWTTIGQIGQEIDISGGEQEYADTSLLVNNIRRQIPTVRSPILCRLPLFWDPSLSFVSVVRAAAEAATLTAVRFTYPNGTIIVGNGYWSMLDIPTIQDSTLRGRIDITFSGLPTVYTS